MSTRLNAEAIYWRFTSKAKLKHMLLMVRLYELGSMKRTAEALSVSQPAVSLMVNELENLLEVELFYRHARGVVPTPVTQELVPVARRIIAAVRDGSEIISSNVNQREGYVRIAATPAALCGIIQPKIGALVQRFGSTLIDINEVAATDSLRAITDDSCDILCLRRPNAVPEGWEFLSVESDSLVTVCSSEHPLADPLKISLESIQEQDWLVSRGGSLAKGKFDQLAQEYGLDERRFCSIITHTPALTIDLLKQSQMLAFVPRSVARPWLDSGDIVQLSLPAAIPVDDIGMLIRAETSSNVTLAVVELLLGDAGRKPL